MATKKQNHDFAKRHMRRREKNSGSEVKIDKTIGKCCRRKYGDGVAS